LIGFDHVAFLAAFDAVPFFFHRINPPVRIIGG
jgi:hypothetical protein